jgi:hypothetical protein
LAADKADIDQRQRAKEDFVIVDEVDGIKVELVRAVEVCLKELNRKVQGELLR